jgi:hypothetical protein
MNVQLSGNPRVRELLAPVARLWGELKSNPRALVGAVAIAGLLALSLLLRLHGAGKELRLDYQKQEAQLQRIAAIAQEGDWNARAKDSAKQLQAQQDLLWTADSDGAAQADLQDWLSHLAQDTGLERPQVKVEVARPKDLPADYHQLTAEINARVTDATMMAFLDRLEKAPHLIVVQQFHAQGAPVSNLQATIITYAELVKTPKAPSP